MKSMLITGGSGGIGRATAMRAARDGWSIAVGYLRNEEAARQLTSTLTTAGVRAVAIRGDIAIEGDVVALFDSAESAIGPLDGVVVNAGIVAPRQSLSEMSAIRLKHMFDTNVYGSYLCAREAARRLGKVGTGGSIVFVSSAAARLGSPFEYVDYAGSKAAIDALTIGLAKELGPRGVRVNSVRPGLIDTDIHRSGGQADRAERLGRETPMGRSGQPEEVAEAIHWLLSDAASYTTGAILDVAGGR